jgi:hypothetical protein
MLIFAVIGGLVRMLLWAVIILQITSALLTDKPNQNILIWVATSPLIPVTFYYL